MRLVLSRTVSDTSSELLFLRGAAGGGTWSEEVPLRFLLSPDGIAILAPRDAAPRWARALSAAPEATWSVDGRQAEGVADAIEDPAELSAVRDGFVSRFGTDEVRRWFPGAVQGFRLRERPSRSRGYLGQVEAYFDRMAPQYDEALQGNRLDRDLRSATGAVLDRTFRPGQRVLEIGCGTGWETLPLARRGIHVLATDLSGEMLRRLEGKAQDEGLESMIETRQLGARDVAGLTRDYPAGSFDGAFSDFGALNCETDLTSLPTALHALLRPGGTLVAAIWNRFCAMEALLCLASLQPHRAMARLESPVPVGRSRYGIPVYARGAGEFTGGFRPLFEVERITGLPVFVPPYDFARATPPDGEFFPILQRLDAVFAARFPFNRFGDHFLVEMRRRP